MAYIERRTLLEIVDDEELKRDCKALKKFQKRYADNLEYDYFEFLKCVDINGYTVQSIKLLRMFIEFLKHRHEGE